MPYIDRTLAMIMGIRQSMTTLGLTTPTDAMADPDIPIPKEAPTPRNIFVSSNHV